MPAPKRPNAPNARDHPGTPLPGPWSPNLGHGLFTMSPMRSLSAFVIAAMTVLMSTFCCLATSAIVVLPSLNFVSSCSVVRLSALAAASISGEPGPGRVPLAVPARRVGRGDRDRGLRELRRARQAGHADQRAPDAADADRRRDRNARYQPTSLHLCPLETIRKASCSATSLGSAWEQARNSRAKCLVSARFGRFASARSGRTQHAHKFRRDHE